MFRWGPKIVTDGLFTVWDAGNKNCYPGYGTTMYDLIGDNDVTLESSGICSVNEGVMTFNASSGGTNYLGVGEFSNIDVLTGYSFSVWVNSTGDYTANYGDRGNILCNNNAGYRFLSFYDSATSYDYPYRIIGENNTNGQYYTIEPYIGTSKKDKWYNISITLSHNTAYTYINGEFSHERSIDDAVTFSRIGGNNYSTFENNQMLEGKIGPVMFYNRELSAEEWHQNYLAMKGRFEDNDVVYYFDSYDILSYKNPTQNSLCKYVDWDYSSGSTNGWTDYGATEDNSRWIDNDPWGVGTMIWDGKSAGLPGVNAGFYTSLHNIDSTKTYRYSMWVDQYVKGTSGMFYMGVTSSSSEWRVCNIVTGEKNVNPYYPATDAQLSGWTLVVGHVFPWDWSATTQVQHEDSGRYMADGTYLGSISRDFKWTGYTTDNFMRTFLYASLDTSVRQRWAFPRVDLCDGTEPSIQDLLNNNPNRVYEIINDNNIGYMINGCEFSNSGQGSILFDGEKSCIITEKDYLLRDYGTITGTFLTTSNATDMVIFSNYPITYDISDIGIDAGHFAWDKTGSAGYKETVDTFNDGEWHHFAVVPSYDRIYIDGINQELQTGTMYRSTQKTLIGARYNGTEYNQFFEGHIGLIKIFRRPLEDWEVLAEYDKIKIRFE